MATIGRQLTAPEAGWKRYDNLEPAITYAGAGWWDDTGYSPFQGSRKVNSASAPDVSIRFNFTGSKLRIIGALSTNWSKELRIDIDGAAERFTELSDIVLGQTLNYEKTGLGSGEHSAILTSAASGYWGLDAIDLDEEGELKPYAPIIPDSNSRALLRVTMVDSSERDYQLTSAEIEPFVQWFNLHTDLDTTGYMLTKKVGSKASKEYLSFHKIISFEIIEL